jgi:type II secretory pathway component PulJ
MGRIQVFVRRNALTIALLLLAASAALSAYAVQVNRRTTAKEVQLATELARTQHALEKTVADSANTRITTVTQRCDFTRLVTNVLIQQDPQVAPPFQKSLAGCEKQLAIVKLIAANSPTTP